MIKRKILIVDDEPDYSLLLKGLLQQEGYQEIDTETNPKLVESILEKNEYDLIADYFRKSGNKIYNKEVTGFTDSVIKILKNYAFPGNIRELENIILNAVAKTQNDQKITKLDIPEKVLKSRGEIPEPGELKPLEEVIDNYIEFVFNQTGRSIKKTSLILGISERTLQRRFKRGNDILS
jgi:DNA-binding NtrC family response regulator